MSLIVETCITRIYTVCTGLCQSRVVHIDICRVAVIDGAKLVIDAWYIFCETIICLYLRTNLLPVVLIFELHSWGELTNGSR